MQMVTIWKLTEMDLLLSFTLEKIGCHIAMNEIVDFDFLCAHMNVCAWVQTASIWNSNA